MFLTRETHVWKLMHRNQVQIYFHSLEKVALNQITMNLVLKYTVYSYRCDSIYKIKYRIYTCTRNILLCKYLSVHLILMQTYTEPQAAPNYHQTSNISCIKSQNSNVSCLILQVFFAQFIEARCEIENEDVVEAALTGDAPTISWWSTILLPTNVHLISEVWG